MDLSADVAIAGIASTHGSDIRRRVSAALLNRATGQSEELPIQLSGGEQQRVGIARAVIEQAIITGGRMTGNLDVRCRKAFTSFEEV